MQRRRKNSVGADSAWAKFAANYRPITMFVYNNFREETPTHQALAFLHFNWLVSQCYFKVYTKNQSNADI